MDKHDPHKLNTMRLWFTPSRFGSIPNHTVREEGYRVPPLSLGSVLFHTHLVNFIMQLSFVLHPSHEPEKFAQGVRTACLEAKEQEPAQPKEDEEEDTQPKEAEEEKKKTKEESEQEKEED